VKTPPAGPGSGCWWWRRESNFSFSCYDGRSVARFDPSFTSLAACFVDQIFKGSNAGDVPIEQATKFDLVINLKTAKALGIRIPGAILLRANRVIE
jgi:hypothetical protein